MASLPYLPEPQLPVFGPWFACERDGCWAPIDVWQPGVEPDALRPSREGPANRGLVGPTRPTLCPDCAISLADSERRETVVARLNFVQAERRLVGSPPGTLIGFELPADNSDAYFMVGLGVEFWPPAFPQLVLPWSVPGCPPKFVVFAICVSIGWTNGPKCVQRWSWEALRAPATGQYLENMVDGVVVPSRPAQWDRLDRARRRLHRVADDARRPRGTGNFAPDEEARAFKNLNQFLEQKERDNVRITSVKMLADEWGVLGRTQTFELFKLFPRLRERYRQHKQRPRRRA